MEIGVLIQKLEHFFQTYGLLTVFVSSLIEITPFGWAVPGGVILAAAGFFASTSDALSVPLIVIAGSLGAWLTFILSYLLGKKTGMWLVEKLHQQKNAALAKNLLKKHGGMILTTSMMANLTRFWIAYVGGVGKYNFAKFLVYSAAASLGWVSVMTFLGLIAGYERRGLEKIVSAVGTAGWLFLILTGVVLYKSILHEFQHFKKDTPHETEPQ